MGVDLTPTFYRAALTNPPTVFDFTSNRAKGKPRRKREGEEEWGGISVYTTEQQCRYKALDFLLGDFIAEVQIPDDGTMRWDTPNSIGHCKLWGDPQAMLSCVTGVVPA